MAEHSRDLTHVSTHFDFGRNWADFAAGLDTARLERARDQLARLLPPDLLAGKRFLDIGSGSGLSAAAALSLGCTALTAVDLDPDSVATSRAVLGRFFPGGPWEVRQASVFDLPASGVGTFDVVHSWGVLHHTGALWRAVEAAAAMVTPNGILAIALYAKTPACEAWKVEKRLYTRAPGWVRAALRGAFKAAYLAALALTGRNPVAYVRDYPAKRGMSWSHDVHDWLGGFPYESATPEETEAFLGARGFALLSRNIRPVPAAGLFGSPCHEYVFRRVPMGSEVS